MIIAYSGQIAIEKGPKPLRLMFQDDVFAEMLVEDFDEMFIIARFHIIKNRAIIYSEITARVVGKPPVEQPEVSSVEMTVEIRVNW